MRIDDTDANRNQREALQPILDGFRWLGIDWDEGPEVGGPHAPYFQSQRGERYQAAVDKLIACGAAYHDYATTAEFAALRDEAQQQKQEFVYDRRWMAESDQDHARFKAEGRTAVVRLKMPRQGDCQFNDGIRGEMSFAWRGEQDHVIQRDDGSFIYHLASVVDDHDFEITHVVRAIEHLPNTPRQIFIAQSLDYPLPVFAHIPFVAESGSQNKLSKRKIEKYLKNPEFKKLYDRGAPIAERLGRHITPESFNPVLVAFYQQIGFRPEAILNYLLLLGWSLDDKTEYFSISQMIDSFSLDRVVKSPASFDPAKLTSFQRHYFNHLSIDERMQLVLPYLQQVGFIPNPAPEESLSRVRAIMTTLEDRLTIAGDIFEYDYFFVSAEAMSYDPKAFDKRIRQADDAVDLLKQFSETLSNHEDFDPESLDELLQQFVEQQQIKIGQIIHALRVSVTGKATGCGLFETLSILGKNECLARIDRSINESIQSQQTTS